jgi:outer membrane immunogenic protein
MIRKFYLLAVLILPSVGTLSAQNAKRAGVHLAFGSEIEQVGLGVNGEFFVAEKVSIAPELNLFFPEKNTYNNGAFKSTYKYSTWSICGDVHYYFVSNDKIGFYGLAGLNLAVARWSTKINTNPPQDNSDSDSELGLNLGVGANFTVPGKIIPFGQVKYETNYEQLLLQAGIRFAF